MNSDDTSPDGSPLDTIAEHDRVSIRAVLVAEGEDADEALQRAGILDAVAIRVVLGDDPDIEGGILGDGITDNLMGVLEPDPEDEPDAVFEPDAPARRPANEAEYGGSGLPAFPAGPAGQSLAPIGRHGR